MSAFDHDPYPGRPKILFIGLSESTHTHGTIDALDGERFNVRLFDVPTAGFAPSSWKKPIYISYDGPTPAQFRPLDPETRRRLYPEPPEHSERLAKRIAEEVSKTVKYRTGAHHQPSVEEHLAQIIREWQPDVIDTLGIHDAGFIYYRTRQQFPDIAGIGKWSVAIRGMPDYELARYDPEEGPVIQAIMQEADCILSDNQRTLQDAIEMGATESQLSPVGPISSSGGLNLDAMMQRWQGPPSQRRAIVMPKTYESPWSVTLPVFEALQLVWEEVQPVEIYMLAMTTGATEMWYHHLPENIKAHCHPIKDRIPREEILDLMTGARVMLATSLLDGMPNVALEAMATGSVPILSPIKTLTPVFEHEKNVLFARNLYPQEIAAALRQAMTDDALVDTIAQTNLDWVRGVLDIEVVRSQFIDYYGQLTEEVQPSKH